MQEILKHQVQLNRLIIQPNELIGITTFKNYVNITNGFGLNISGGNGGINIGGGGALICGTGDSSFGGTINNCRRYNNKLKYNYKRFINI
jgi:hypothetical protein